MKKLTSMVLLTVMLAALLSGTVFAAGETKTETLAAGFYLATPTGMTVTPVTESETKTITVGEKSYTYYPGAEKLNVALTGTSGKEYLVMLVEGSFETAPTQANKILYINQQKAGSTAVSFSGSEAVFPMLDGVAKDQSLTLFVTSNDGQPMKKAELFYSTGGDYEVQQYKLGDVNGDGTVNATDALLALQIAGNLHTPTATQMKAADVTKDDVVNANDALKILQYAGGIITEW